jgi:hypothetical protein
MESLIVIILYAILFISLLSLPGFGISYSIFRFLKVPVNFAQAFSFIILLILGLIMNTLFESYLENCSFISFFWASLLGILFGQIHARRSKINKQKQLTTKQCWLITLLGMAIITMLYSYTLIDQ